LKKIAEWNKETMQDMKEVINKDMQILKNNQIE
jgi:hypothetical protein